MEDLSANNHVFRYFDPYHGLDVGELDCYWYSFASLGLTLSAADHFA
jgi:hypothetical protein